ncbi:MAG: HAD family hydrolase [Leptolyngbya sp. SIO4C1]|nr:HAD family hydrolase [Leptolyngbya sp. SIO4C1]
MNQATQPLFNRIAVVFDFDDTLVPDTYDALIEDLGHDAKRFREERYYPLLKEGWDGISARFYTLIQESQQRSESQKITQNYLAEFGQRHQPFSGVSETFEHLRQQTRNFDSDIEIEFYLITSGFVEIARNSSIASEFKAMWGCEFHYSETGEIQYLKRSVSHPEKTRYLYYLSKGIESHSEDDLLFVYEDVPPEELQIPLNQVIYVGDGTSDLPCFSLMNQTGGIGIGVYPDGTAKDWAQEYKVSRSQRVANLAPADYSEASELRQSLTLAVESLCKQIELRQLSLGE